MLNKKTVFRTISFANYPGLDDYPKHLPLPRKDDIIQLNGKCGLVSVVKHMTEGNVTEIKIICISL